MKRLGNFQVKDYFFVSLQFLLFIAYFIPVDLFRIELPGWLRMIALVLVIFGIGLALFTLFQLRNMLSVFPTPVNSGKLITSGAFSISRHPIYTAIILSAFSFGIFSESAFRLIITILLFIFFYFISNYEEQLLLLKYPEYSNYKKSTRKFL
ncbi:isoprenylcysteine carboxylmethyltransferase family protein [uncultured Christiangramia sp.]|uniref:methyltransferase family protein n=1 Tax=Christiangramia sp. 3-2217-3z TaxID=3417564 RepID=UPI0026162370|nr:isoprenylcysteine carboxylmethyltransferase family protein [uncultured Christiangramia sp.]